MIPSPVLLLIFPLFCENYFLSMSTRKSEKFDTLQGAYNKIVVVFSCLSQKIIDRTLCVAILSVSFMVNVLFLYFSCSLSLSTFSISITMIHKTNICRDKTNIILIFLMYIFQTMELFYTFRIKTIRCIRFTYIFVRSITSFRQNIG